MAAATASLTTPMLNSMTLPIPGVMARGVCGRHRPYRPVPAHDERHDPHAMTAVCGMGSIKWDTTASRTHVLAPNEVCDADS